MDFIYHVLSIIYFLDEMDKKNLNIDTKIKSLETQYSDVVTWKFGCLAVKIFEDKYPNAQFKLNEYCADRCSINVKIEEV